MIQAAESWAARAEGSPIEDEAAAIAQNLMQVAGGELDPRGGS